MATMFVLLLAIVILVMTLSGDRKDPRNKE